MKVVIQENAETVARELCETILQVYQDRIESSDTFSMAISGGSLLNLLQHEIAYELLWNSHEVDFEKWHIFLVDERVVSLDSKDSNCGVFMRIKPWKPYHIYSLDFQAQQTTEKMCSLYCDKIQAYFNGKEPSYDLVLLGIGPDGHTASLFPGQVKATEPQIMIPVLNSPKMPKERISMSLSFINNSKNVVFVVTGYEKKDVVKSIIVEKDTSLPASLVHPVKGKLVWILDRLASLEIADKMEEINKC